MIRDHAEQPIDVCGDRNCVGGEVSISRSAGPKRPDAINPGKR